MTVKNYRNMRRGDAIKEALTRPTVILSSKTGLYAIYQKTDNGYLCLITNDPDNPSGKPVAVETSDFEKACRAYLRKGWGVIFCKRKQFKA